MAGRKLARDFLFSKQPLFRQLLSRYQLPEVRNSRLLLVRADASLYSRRQFSVFNEFSKKFAGDADRSKEFQKTIKELKVKAEELKGVKEDIKHRTKQTTEQLYKHVDGVWTEAESTAKKVSGNVKEKISAAKEEVKETLGIGKQESSSSTGSSSTGKGSDTKDGSKAKSSEEQQQSGSADDLGKLFGKFKSSVSSASPKVTVAFKKLKEAKVIDLAKKGYDVVIDELSGKPIKRKRTPYTASSGETSARTEIVVVPSTQSPWSKKWEAFKDKLQGHPMFKRFRKMSEPVVVKGQELAEDMQERWETSDSPVVHKIQDLNDKVFGENPSALSLKEIRRRDPSFSLPEFVAEVQDVIRPILIAYIKADEGVLNKYCSPEVIERCKAERKAYESKGMFMDSKILHISEADVRETKMMGSTPIIILMFQTQQVHCVRDSDGNIAEGGKDTIHTVYYAWAMQQLQPDELKEDGIYSMWRLREMQQLGIQALI